MRMEEDVLFAIHCPWPCTRDCLGQSPLAVTTCARRLIEAKEIATRLLWVHVAEGMRRLPSECVHGRHRGLRQREQGRVTGSQLDECGDLLR